MTITNVVLLNIKKKYKTLLEETCRLTVSVEPGNTLYGLSIFPVELRVDDFFSSSSYLVFGSLERNDAFTAEPADDFTSETFESLNEWYQELRKRVKSGERRCVENLLTLYENKKDTGGEKNSSSFVFSSEGYIHYLLGVENGLPIHLLVPINRFDALDLAKAMAIEERQQVGNASGVLFQVLPESNAFEAPRLKVLSGGTLDGTIACLGDPEPLERVVSPMSHNGTFLVVDGAPRYLFVPNSYVHFAEQILEEFRR